MGGVDVGLGVGEVPCLFHGLDDDVLFLFPDWVFFLRQWLLWYMLV